MKVQQNILWNHGSLLHLLVLEIRHIL